MAVVLRKAKVLVVEDDIHLLEGIRDILELDGYSVLTAENGNHGLEVLHNQSSPPDLIVSDIMMPKMDGIQFLKEVRKESRWLEIPFIFLTAKGEKSDYQKGMRLGVDDYVVKPYDPGDLLVKIESRLERLRAVRNAHSEVMNNLKRQILTILNHEFRTPLTFVVAYADMLNEPDAQQLSQEEILSYLKGVSGGAERLRNLIENFILLVEIETGDIKNTYNWRKRPVESLNEVFTAATERVKLFEPTKLRTIEARVEGGIAAFEGDPEYLTTAMCHLLQNAIKFYPSDTATPNAIATGATLRDGKLVLWVKDEGRGIPKMELDSVWQSFYQIDRGHNEDQGAGAGLAIVRGIAELHGGTVSVTSEPGKGSTFEMILPLEKIAQ
ncbi:MAG: response regulator [Anaerolineae bacterium]|nr:response regulator [Anaerolineae bacterium]